MERRSEKTPLFQRVPRIGDLVRQHFTVKDAHLRMIRLSIIIFAGTPLLMVLAGLNQDTASSSIHDAQIDSSMVYTAMPPKPESIDDEVEPACMSDKQGGKFTPCNMGIPLAVLLKQEMPATYLQDLVACIHPLQAVRCIPHDNTITVLFCEPDGRLLQMEFSLHQEQSSEMASNAEQAQTDEGVSAFESRHRVVSGAIRHTLFSAAVEAGLPPALISQMEGIFASNINYEFDIQTGDTFMVLFEQKYSNDCFLEYGRILAASIVNRGRPLWAFYYERNDGKADYYDEQGRSLQSSFLKSPLKYKRISSRFSYRRLHPILKIYRPHQGIDYAAPLGTPVRAIGDGRVLFAGWKGEYGRFVEILHNEAYRSTYGHLHRFARNIRSGRYVRKGQNIGYVGSTGLATGPHLDFRLIKSGQFVDPLNEHLLEADQLCEKERVVFRKHVNRVLSELGKHGLSMAQVKDHPISTIKTPS